MKYRFFCAFILACTAASSAFAHARVESSFPKKNAVLKSSPSEVKIVFSEPLRIKESYIKVFSGKKQLSEAAPSLAPDQ
jgi:methionine-rich copper-binding protein CopC